MKILSKFKDYYDCAQALGQDQTFVYRRYTKEIPHKELVENEVRLPPHGLTERSDGDSHLRYHKFVIGFCGKLYPVVDINTTQSYCNKGGEACTSTDYRAQRKCCYNMEDLDSWIKLHFKDDTEWYYGTAAAPRNRRYPPSYGRRRGEEARHNFSLFFEPVMGNDYLNDYGELFIQFNTPSFYVKTQQTSKQWEHTLVLHPCLKDFEFFRVFDPHHCYQEISMFLGNLAEPRKPIPPIDDVTMAEAKGFDKVFSFRKPKSNKKTG